MGIESLINIITSHAKFSEFDIEIIKSKFIYNKFKQKDYILTEGHVSTYIHYVLKGLVRVFYLREGKEVTTYLSSDNGFVSSYPSFRNLLRIYNVWKLQRHSQLIIKTCRNCMKLYLNGKK